MKLIDKIEHTGEQMVRWIRVFLIILFILFIIFFVIKPMYENNKIWKEYNSNVEKIQRLDRGCLENIGEITCKNEGGTLSEINIDEFTFKSVFICWKNNKKMHINISEEQLNSCL